MLRVVRMGLPCALWCMMPGMKRKLPISIQTFRKIREEGYYYVDKSPYALRLAREGGHYFLSRPRRFGKSLFVDTLKSLFEGTEALFRGLAIHDQWDWSVRRPVVRLSLASGSFATVDLLHSEIMARLEDVAEEHGITGRHDTAPARLRHMLASLHRLTGQRVVVLVDEYDKPILEVLASPDAAKANRDYLRGLYSTVKDSDEHIAFSFFTGVSKFSKVSLFSDLNNLSDITLKPAYSAICGYTDADLDTVFAAELEGVDRQALRRWYNGYCWLGDERVYNPQDVLRFFQEGQFDNYWFETGSPRFLVDMLLAGGLENPKLDGMLASDQLLSAFDADHIGTEALMFQSGYLTITDVQSGDGGQQYRLGYPNEEVRRSLNLSLLLAMTPSRIGSVGVPRELRAALQEHDFASVEDLFRRFLSSIPYNWHVRNNIADFEGYYASIFYICFMAAGFDVRAEDATSRGRLDMAVLFRGHVYLFEFKVVELAPEGGALAQLQERRYAEKYKAAGTSVHLIGVEFSREERNVVAFDVETVAE